jgi:2-polyprenyl-6-methoxyphenol hydroxylase-like FAD-dependent oxidoreductase
MYDAIIVGARCAGSPTAMLLTRNGYRTLVLDRDEFPSDIMSTHFIQPEGTLALERWGLLDALVASGCPPLTHVTTRLGDLAMVPPREPGMPEATYCPRRTVLDKILVDAARAAGAEVREGCSVQELTFDGDRVTGVKARGRDGATFTEEARVVIGADGMHSFVARAVAAPEYNTREAMNCGYYSYWSGLDSDGAQLCMNGKTALLAFPTHDDMTCVAIMRPITDFHAFRTDIDGQFQKYAREALPMIGDQLAGARREEKYIGTADTRNFFRKPYGPGWALAGDAGYHRDPVTGLGIADAFRDAELLASALHEGFSGERQLDNALADHETRRNEAAAPGYERTLFFAMLPTKDEVLQAMQQQATAAPSAL